MPIPRPEAPHVVAIGGGTGLPVLLSGLRETLFPAEWKAFPVRGRDYLTAIVTVADDGGSSGVLRRAYGIQAPGDLRNCLLALAEGDPTLEALFRFRFSNGDGLAGHNLGNLILTALSLIERQFPAAVERAGDILRTRGRVLPATIDDVELVAEMEDGRQVAGESRIGRDRSRIRRVELRPSHARALPQACEAIEAADIVVIGPGSLYSSLISVLLVRELAEAIARSRARVMLAMNLMTEPGETDGYGALEHLTAIERHAPEVRIHDVLLNGAAFGEARLRRYGSAGAHPVAVDAAALSAHGCRPWTLDLLVPGDKASHDSRKLAAAVMRVAAQASSPALAMRSLEPA